MRWQSWREHTWCVAIIFALSSLLQVDLTFSQSELQEPSAQSIQEGDPLPPAIRRTLEAELAQEEKAKKIGVERYRSFPIPVCNAGKCGAVNRDGTFAVVPTYEWVDTFSEGRAAVRVRHRYSYLYGYVDDTGRMIWKPQFPTRDRFRRGFVQVDIDGKSGLIDRDGKVALWPQFGFVVPFTNDLFWATEERNIEEGNNGRQKFLFDEPRMSVNGVSDTDIMPKGKWGLVDRAGSWIRRPEFLAVRVFDQANSQLMWARTRAGWGLIRPDLSWEVEPRFDDVGPLQDGLAIVVVDHRWGFVDANGRIVIETAFDRAFEFSGPYAPAKSNKFWGLIDRNGGWALEPQYDLIMSNGIVMPKSWWAVKENNKWGLLDNSLRVVISPQFDQSPSMCTDGRIFGIIDRKWKLYSRDGTQDEHDEAGCDSMISNRRNLQSR